MAGPSLIDPFHRQLYPILMGELAERKDKLAAGAAARIQNDTHSVAENYAAQVAYIKALEDIIQRCAQLERDMQGGGSREE